MAKRSEPLIALRSKLLHACFEREETVFASGRIANNKLDLELLPEHNPVLYPKVVSTLARLALRNCNPDFIVGVPNGATKLAEDVARRAGTSFVKMHKVDGEVIFADQNSQEIANYSHTGVLIEDVFNRFTNTRKTLSVGSLASSVVGAYAIWDRGNPKERQELDVPHFALIQEYIPEQLEPWSTLWRYAN